MHLCLRRCILPSCQYFLFFLWKTSHCSFLKNVLVFLKGYQNILSKSQAVELACFARKIFNGIGKCVTLQWRYAVSHRDHWHAIKPNIYLDVFFQIFWVSIPHLFKCDQLVAFWQRRCCDDTRCAFDKTRAIIYLGPDILRTATQCGSLFIRTRLVIKRSIHQKKLSRPCMPRSAHGAARLCNPPHT